MIATVAAAFAYTVFVWWFSTGAILWLDRRPAAFRPWSMAGVSLVALLAACGLISTLGDASPSGAVCAFTCALGLWGWHEAAFLAGWVTGPRVAPCPPEASAWRRFRLAASTLIFHELALVATAAIVVAASWGQANPVGAWTFLVLLASRLSAKLNLFFGVPNFSEEFFPDRLRYMTSYLRRSPASVLFPLSIAAGAALAGGEAWGALHAGASAFEVTGFSLIFVLTALAMVEHAFMVIPLPDAALWRWALPTPAPSPAATRSPPSRS
jgi:putative photosynthetic complex assembly protein 2